jgi:hypothetical protein
MSAFGPKRTWAVALQMSAFGGKADMTIAPRKETRIFAGLFVLLLEQLVKQGD